MKKFAAAIIAAMAALMWQPVSAQDTQRFTAGKHNEYGLTYSLPTTHLRIVVEAERTVYKAGPYYKYAKKYLGTTDVVTKDRQEWTLKNVDVWTYGVPNRDKEYLMQFKGANNVYAMKSEDGLLLSLNAENVVSPAATRKAVEETESVLEDNAYIKALSAELLAGESTSKRAQIAAQQIYNIRESRTNYALGEADQMPPDGEALKLIMKQLDEQEAALTALFVGTKQVGTYVKVYDYVPDSLDVSNSVVMRISDYEGMVDSDNLSGEPLYLSMKVVERGELPIDEKGVTKRVPKGAVMYCMPGKARFTFTYEGKKVAEQTFDVSQLGVEFGLDPKLFSNKKAPSFVKFYPETGAIMEIGAAERPQP